jgi:Dolichyl-phosphate-mannose-protein mannosyltransferase
MKTNFIETLAAPRLICGVALVARLSFIAIQCLRIPREVLAVVPFQQETGNIAYALVRGHGFADVFRADTGPTAWLAPVYPLLLAGVFKIFGAFTFPAFLTIASLNAMFSAAACIPIFLATRRVAGVSAGSLAAWLWAVFPNAIVMPFEWVWDTPLSALLAATILWSTLELGSGDRSPRWRDWSLYGLLWGFALMTNPSVGSVLPFLLAWLIYRSYKFGRFRWVQLALVLGMVLLCCAPWTIRNYRQFGRFVPIRSNFPFELWLGNNDVYDLHPPHTRTRITRYEEARSYAQAGEVAFMEDKWEKATSFIVAHPALEAQLAGRRFVATWTGLDNPIQGFRTGPNLVRWALLCNFVVSLGALTAILVLATGFSDFVVPLAAFPLVFPVLYYVTHTSLRYRHPVDPVLILLTALTLRWFWRGLPARIAGMDR